MTHIRLCYNMRKVRRSTKKKHAMKIHVHHTCTKSQGSSCSPHALKTERQKQTHTPLKCIDIGRCKFTITTTTNSFNSSWYTKILKAWFMGSEGTFYMSVLSAEGTLVLLVQCPTAGCRVWKPLSHLPSTYTKAVKAYGV